MPLHTVDLSDADSHFAEAEAAAAGHESASAYMAALVQERRQQTIARVQALLIEGGQGEMTEMTRADLDDIRREVHARLAGERRA